MKTLRQWAGLTPPNSLPATKTALLLIDLQMEYFKGNLPLPEREKAIGNVAQLLDWARNAGISVIHVVHEATSPTSLIAPPGTEMVQIHPLLAPDPQETVITKNLPSSFKGTRLKETLEERKIELLVICGFMTHMCVDSTAREALHLGYKVIIAADACASRDLPDPTGNGLIDHRTVHRTALAALADRFADVMDTENICSLTLSR